MVIIYPRLLALMGGLVGTLLVLVTRYDPARPYARALRSLVAGLFLLMAWNALSLPRLGINPLSMWLTGSLGLPGLLLMAVLNVLC